MTRRDAQSMGHVALVVGGDSAEREVSLRGGQAVAGALERLGVQFSVVDGPRRLLEQVAAGHYDRVFNLLHGRGGEDGALQGALRLYGIPVTGSGVLGSALTMDKLQTKRVWAACGLPTPRWQVAREVEAAESILQALGLPLFVKPAHEGSSIGMSRVDEAGELPGAIAAALEFDDTVLVEQCIVGQEYTASVLDGEVLPLIGLEPTRKFYDYAAKYESGDTRYRCPCGLDEARERSLAELCMEAFAVTGAAGWGRVDLMLDGDGQPWLLEVNTTPGMTESSLVPKAAKAAGIDFEELVWRILTTSRND
ncbi:D-alanine--D-alanine ligase [Wenzhouxiangella marina]|uniref:D-alanine--D-alanine ligase n=1 Tax=Wenzhouxiangella marina TaxID=1579979 RepID=A0A0K0XYI4_9GAMM|nr:D-alanine--D-alanine ligase [Wenzhouxiangella marina]AKS42725.1 D-alanine--D-alanine ligase [Wenzhouxiangella marina]MBB6088585.1 D-alanine-D-alanine ligase [Wenzhouxiangella marina]